MADYQGSQTMMRKWNLSYLLCFVSLCLGIASRADELDELPLEEWKQLREVERYQLQIAEKYWREQNWKTAAGEYEKFVELYERSNAAPFAQLKWSLAQVKLRQQNTAIKEGFQTVIDYWPDSPSAIAAAYYTGRTLREIGRLKEAKTALKAVVAKHPEHLASVYALNDLLEIATVENDAPARLEYWKKLTFDIPRSRFAANICVSASQQLAVHGFREGAFADAVRALATTYKPDQMPAHVAQFIRSPLVELVSQAESKTKGEKLAQEAIVWFRQTVPTDQSTPEAKQLARQCLLSAADVTALALSEEQVVAAYNAVLQNASPDDEALGRLAAWQKSKQKFDPARDTYRRYADRNEGQGQVAASYREQQNWTAAVDTYRQLAGTDAERKVRWKQELALTFRYAQKWPDAIAVYEELVRDDLANAARYRWEVACTHRDAGQHREAIGNFRQCENFPENYKQMAWCHRQLKQPAEAIILYNQVTSDPNSAPWALLQIAYTREEAGQQEPAIQAFQQVCKKYPKDSHASVAHAHLQQKYKISITLGGATQE